MAEGISVRFENAPICVTDEEVSTTVRMIEFAGVKRPIEDVWHLLCAVDPARVPRVLTIKIDDTPLREALESLMAIKTIRDASYAGKLYYNFVGVVGPLRAQR